jgi:hypothetical protein
LRFASNEGGIDNSSPECQIPPIGRATGRAFRVNPNSSRGEALMPSIKVNGYDMAFVERGAGAALILVHGTLCDYSPTDGADGAVRGALPNDRPEPQALLARTLGR